MIDEDKTILRQFQPNLDYESIQLIESRKISLNPGSGRKIIQKIIVWILPSFLQNHINSSALKAPKLYNTSYLNGLRGLASFVVFLGHYTEENIGWYIEPYGLYEDGAPSSPLQLPFIRVIYSARPMVHIFFVISGLVLSYKPLRHIHSQKFLSLEKCLSSSVFRRAIRLFLPSFAALFITALAVGSGISDTRYSFHNGKFFHHFCNSFRICWNLVGASWAIDFLDIVQPEYNPALWSIPVEFSQSLILFVTILGLSRCVCTIRMGLLITILWYCFRSGHLYTVEFLGGLLIAELILLQERSLNMSSESPIITPIFDLQTGNQSENKFRVSNIRLKLLQIFWIFNIVFALFISSWTNEHFDEVWGISFMSRKTPEPYDVRNGARVWFCLAAFQIVAACTQLSWIKSFLNTSIPQYLGNISFPLYLTHNLCLTILEPKFTPILENIIGKTSFWGRHIFWAVGLLVYVPVIIIVSDLFWRLIDIPSTKFAYWLESRCVVDKIS